MALPYYPAMPNEDVDEDAEDVAMAAEFSAQTQSQKKRAFKEPVAPGVQRPLGHPKMAKAPAANQPSILNFFSKK